VDADGILHVTAKELSTLKEARIDVKPSYGLTDEEAEQMLRDAYAHGADDIRTKMLVEERVEADRILAATATALAKDGDLLDPEERAKIDHAVARLVSLKAGSDHRAIHEAISALDETARDFASLRMNRALQKGVAGRSVEEMETKL